MNDSLTGLDYLLELMIFDVDATLHFLDEVLWFFEQFPRVDLQSVT